VFDNKDVKRSKIQAIEEYLNDNAKEYSSALYVEGIFSYEIDAPIENWFLNSVENLRGLTVDLPLNWMDVSGLVYQINGLYSIHFLWKELKKKDLTHQLQLFVSGNNKILKNY